MNKVQLTVLGYVSMFTGYIVHLSSYKLTGLFAFGMALGFFIKAMLKGSNEKK